MRHMILAAFSFINYEGAASSLTVNLNYETGSITGILAQIKRNPLKRRMDIQLAFLDLIIRARIPTEWMTLSQRLQGVVETKNLVI